MCFVYSMTRWQEMCTNMPFVAQEILFAWEHGALSPDYVKVGLTFYYSLKVINILCISLYQRKVGNSDLYLFMHCVSLFL